MNDLQWVCKTCSKSFSTANSHNGHQRAHRTTKRRKNKSNTKAKRKKSNRKQRQKKARSKSNDKHSHRLIKRNPQINANDFQRYRKTYSKCFHAGAGKHTGNIHGMNRKIKCGSAASNTRQRQRKRRDKVISEANDFLFYSQIAKEYQIPWQSVFKLLQIRFNVHIQTFSSPEMKKIRMHTYLNSNSNVDPNSKAMQMQMQMQSRYWITCHLLLNGESINSQTNPIDILAHFKHCTQIDSNTQLGNGLHATEADTTEAVSVNTQATVCESQSLWKVNHSSNGAGAKWLSKMKLWSISSASASFSETETPSSLSSLSLSHSASASASASDDSHLLLPSLSLSPFSNTKSASVCNSAVADQTVAQPLIRILSKQSETETETETETEFNVCFDINFRRFLAQFNHRSQAQSQQRQRQRRRSGDGDCMSLKFEIVADEDSARDCYDVFDDEQNHENGALISFGDCYFHDFDQYLRNYQFPSHIDTVIHGSNENRGDSKETLIGFQIVSENTSFAVDIYPCWRFTPHSFVSQSNNYGVTVDVVHSPQNSSQSQSHIVLHSFLSANIQRNIVWRFYLENTASSKVYFERRQPKTLSSSILICQMCDQFVTDDVRQLWLHLKWMHSQDFDIGVEGNMDGAAMATTTSAPTTNICAENIIFHVSINAFAMDNNQNGDENDNNMDGNHNNCSVNDNADIIRPFFFFRKYGNDSSKSEWEAQNKLYLRILSQALPNGQPPPKKRKSKSKSKLKSKPSAKSRLIPIDEEKHNSRYTIVLRDCNGITNRRYSNEEKRFMVDYPKYHSHTFAEIKNEKHLFYVPCERLSIAEQKLKKMKSKNILKNSQYRIIDNEYLVEPEMSSDSDLDCDDSQFRIYENEVNLKKKFGLNEKGGAFCLLWNTFIISVDRRSTLNCNLHIPYFMVPVLLLQFTTKCKTRLRKHKLRNELLSHLMNMFQFGLCEAKLIENCMYIFDG